MKKLVIFLIVFISSTALYAQDWKSQGESMQRARNYTGAAAMYEMCMEQDIDCLYNLLFLIVNEHIVAETPNQAFRLISPHAQNGDSYAQYLLGWMYLHGRGVAQNYAEALRWSRRSADQDNLGGQHNLGFMYENGYGVPLDLERAIYWYKKAVDGGSSRARNDLRRAEEAYAKIFIRSRDLRKYGYTIGYAKKHWMVSSDNSTFAKQGIWSDNKDSRPNCLQLGFTFEPRFKYGFAMKTGISYMFYHLPNDNDGMYSTNAKKYNFEKKLSEHSLYIPLHLQYRVSFNEYIQVFVQAGPSVDLGFSGVLRDPDNRKSKIDFYRNSDLELPIKPINFSIDYGAGIDLGAFQLYAGFCRGLSNISTDPLLNIRQNKFMFSVKFFHPNF